MSEQHARQLRCRIEVREAAAERAAVARLHVSDMMQCLGEQGAAGGDQRGILDLALAGHGADHHGAAVLGDPRELRHTVQIHQVRRRQVAEIHHRHQRLPAGQQLRILEPREGIDNLGHGLRAVIGEGRGLHGSFAPAASTCFFWDSAKRPSMKRDTLLTTPTLRPYCAV